jgi:hypothetical protein
MAAVWPWVTAGILMIFRASMRQARIKPIHILRCVLYTGDSVMWAAFAAAVIVWLAAGRTVVTQNDLPASLWLSFIGVIGLAFPLFSLVKLRAACLYYLRFRHAWATVAASQIILILAALVVVTNFDYYVMGRLV